MKPLQFLIVFALTIFPNFLNSQIVITPISNNCPNNSNCYQFSLLSTGFSNAVDPVYGVAYFWHFGDGEWSTEKSPIHEYDSAIPDINEIYVEVTPVRLLYGYVYDDDDDIVKRFIADNTVNNYPPSPGTSTLTAGSNGNFINIDYNRSLVESDDVTFIITYSTESQFSGNASISFKYNSNQLLTADPTLPSTLLGTYQNENTVPLIGDFVERRFDVFSTNGNYRHLLIRLKVQPGLALETAVSFSAELVIPAEPRDITSVVAETTYTLKSHDPNTIFTEASFICDSPPLDSIFKYKIIFQNEGNGAADSVMIKHFIPEYFDIESINSFPKGNVIINNSMSINSLHREVTWFLKDCSLKGCGINSNLKGTNQSGIGKSFLIKDTYDTIEYQISLARAVKPCEAIVTQAEIYFDDNPPVWTNPFVTAFGCHEQPLSPNPLDPNPNEPIPGDSITLNSNHEKIKDSTNDFPSIILSQIISQSCDTCVFDSIFSPLQLPLDFASINNPVSFIIPNNWLPAFSNTNGLIYQWYPSYTLNNSRIKNVTAKPCRNTHYFLTITDTINCSRRIIHMPVKVTGTPCISTPCIPTWLIILIFSILIGFIIIKIIKK